jgi:hypothetical protein
MSVSSQFSGGANVPKALINAFSAGGRKAQITNLAGETPVKVVATGALTAGVLSTVLSLTGKGSVCFLGCVGADTTSRTHRLKVTIDGVVVFDATSSACTATYQGVTIIGHAGPTSNDFSYLDTAYNQSFLVEYASSLTETAMTNIGYLYRTY